MIAHKIKLKVQVQCKEILTRQQKNLFAKIVIMFQGGLISQW